MKPTVADYRFKTFCVRIVPLWGAPVYLTSFPRDLTMNGHVYRTDSGYTFSGVPSESSMAPGVMDLDGIADVAGISRAEIVSGVFDNARVYCFATAWTNPVEDEEPIGLAFMGRTTIRDHRYTAELMMAVDALNQSVGDTYTAACRKTFGGQEYAGCKVDLAPITVTGTLTGVSGTAAFADDTRTEADDWFGEGTIAFTSGPNAGLKPMEIRSYAADGSIVLHDAMPYMPAVGDAYVMIPGCRKRQEDCRDKWSNIDNFGGFSFVPTQSTYSQIGQGG